MNDSKQIDEYVEAVAQCLSKLIKDCSVKWEQTPTVYIFTIKVSLNSKYVMEFRALDAVDYVYACMRIGNPPEDLAEKLLIQFFDNTLSDRYTDAGLEILNRRVFTNF